MVGAVGIEKLGCFSKAGWEHLVNDYRRALVAFGNEETAQSAKQGKASKPFVRLWICRPSVT
jgi:hypothetical protein